MSTDSDGEVFVASRGARWHYASDCVEHVEEHNCAKGCRRGLADPDRFVDCGPGGSCELLARVFIGEPIPEFYDDGTTILCTAREAL